MRFGGPEGDLRSVGRPDGKVDVGVEKRSHATACDARDVEFRVVREDDPPVIGRKIKQVPAAGDVAEQCRAPVPADVEHQVRFSVNAAGGKA